MAAQWNPNNMACQATWAILSSYMNQIKGPFDEQATPQTTMGNLRYWPKAGVDESMMPGLTFGMAHQFLLLVQDHYTSVKQDPLVDSLTIVRKVQAVFAKQDATLTDLAAALDDVARFPNEAMAAPAAAVAEPAAAPAKAAGAKKPAAKKGAAS
jgi:hypothetical protein